MAVDNNFEWCLFRKSSQTIWPGLNLRELTLIIQFKAQYNLSDWLIWKQDWQLWNELAEVLPILKIVPLPVHAQTVPPLPVYLKKTKASTK